LVGTTRKKPLGNGVTVHNGSKPGHNRLIWQGKVGKSTGYSRFNACKRWNRLRNPIKNRATENSEFNLQWKNTKIIPSK
jgi:hypothetical protein